MTAAHVAAGLAALLAGLVVVVRPKGTAGHRRLGAAYVLAMLALAATALLLYPSGGLTPFHGVAVVVTGQVIAGVAMARRRPRRPGWHVWHLRLMLYSYVALAGTTLSQFWDALPLAPPARALVFLLAPALLAWGVIEYRTVPAWAAAFDAPGSATPSI